MKRYFFIIVLIIVCGLGSAFDAPKQETKKDDNYTIQRLMLYNKAGNILMEKNAYGWMTPALRSNENLSLQEGLNELAKKMGFEMAPISLCGIFTYKFEGLNDHVGHVSYRTHYKAKVKSGAVLQPTDKSIHYEWLTEKQAQDSIGHPALKAEFSQMIKHPDKIWGGSFLCIFKNDKLENIKQTEAFYSLHD